MHAAVFSEINLAIHNGIAEIPNRRIRRDRLIFLCFFLFVKFIVQYFTVDVLNGTFQQFGQFCTLHRNTGRFLSIGTDDHLHFTEDHIRIINKILIHTDAVFICVQMYPVGFNVYDTVTLLEE